MFAMVDQNVMSLSIAQVAEIQDELYAIREAVSNNSLLKTRISSLISKFDMPTAKHIEEESTYKVNPDEFESLIAKLMRQAQQQCQQ